MARLPGLNTSTRSYIMSANARHRSCSRPRHGGRGFTTSDSSLAAKASTSRYRRKVRRPPEELVDVGCNPRRHLAGSFPRFILVGMTRWAVDAPTPEIHISLRGPPSRATSWAHEARAYPTSLLPVPSRPVWRRSPYSSGRRARRPMSCVRRSSAPPRHVLGLHRRPRDLPTWMSPWR